jgi:hypothetical protein
MTQKCSPDVLTDTAASPATAEQRLLKLSHLYHVAYSEDLYSILRRGIQPSETSHRDKLESTLPQVAEQFDLDFPIDRQNCVFFYPRIQQALEQVPTESKSCTWPSSKEIVVVDGADIDQPMYIGEFRLISDAIDFQYKDKPDDAMISVSFDDALRRYAATLRPVDSLAALPKLCDRYELAEVIIEDGVDPETIVGWESFTAG